MSVVLIFQIWITALVTIGVSGYICAALDLFSDKIDQFLRALFISTIVGGILVLLWQIPS